MTAASELRGLFKEATDVIEGQVYQSEGVVLCTKTLIAADADARKTWMLSKGSFWSNDIYMCIGSLIIFSPFQNMRSKRGHVLWPGFIDGILVRLRY